MCISNGFKHDQKSMSGDFCVLNIIIQSSELIAETGHCSKTLKIFTFIFLVLLKHEYITLNIKFSVCSVDIQTLTL